MTNEHLKQLLFIDIETAPIVPDYSQLGDHMQRLWSKKAASFRSISAEEADPAKLFSEKAGIFSEFSRVVCIGIGSIISHQNEWRLRLKSICHEDEKVLLNNFIMILERFRSAYKDMRFCGHNIKEFDLPFLCRRMLIQGLTLPAPLQLSGKKPWENPHLDTLELWKFGDYKHYTSLALLAEVLGIPSPKDDMDGSMVGRVYWEQKDEARIARYCLQDVRTAADVFLHLSGRSDLQPPPLILNDNDE